MGRITFDLEDLRSFVTGVELGSFAKAAERLGRSTSAVSAHLKKLEQQVGAPILRKAGRGMVMTEAGKPCSATRAVCWSSMTKPPPRCAGWICRARCGWGCRRISARRFAAGIGQLRARQSEGAHRGAHRPQCRADRLGAERPAGSVAGVGWRFEHAVSSGAGAAAAALDRLARLRAGALARRG